jgi:rubrerythrin
LHDIANEERVHAGEFQRLLNILLEDEERFLAEGAEEVNDMAREDGAAAGAANEESKATQPTVPTVGNLKKINIAQS